MYIGRYHKISHNHGSITEKDWRTSERLKRECTESEREKSPEREEENERKEREERCSGGKERKEGGGVRLYTTKGRGSMVIRLSHFWFNFYS